MAKSAYALVNPFHHLCLTRWFIYHIGFLSTSPPPPCIVCVPFANVESSDAVTDQLVLRFAGFEDYANKLVKDVTQFRDAVDSLLSSSTDFARGFTVLFSPIGGEAQYEFESKFPNAKATIQHIGEYQAAFDELKMTIQPELELVDSRVVGPSKELQENIKRIRKTITKREHKVCLLSGEIEKVIPLTDHNVGSLPYIITSAPSSSILIVTTMLIQSFEKRRRRV